MDHGQMNTTTKFFTVVCIFGFCTSALCGFLAFNDKAFLAGIAQVFVTTSYVFLLHRIRSTQ